MKTYRCKLGVSIFIVLLSFSLCLYAVLHDPAETTAQTFSLADIPKPQYIEESTAQPVQTAYTPQKTPLFTIRLVGDELRVIPFGRKDDYTIIPSADPRTFREADRLRLIDGIEIYSTQELAEIIEDFSS